MTGKPAVGALGRLSRVLPVLEWAPRYRRADLRGDIASGLTIGAMLVPQAMAYALLAGLPPEVGLYASTIPLIAYALLGTSRQLAVGPVAIVSLITAATLAPIVDEGTAAYVAAAAVLALLVGVIHLVMGIGRLGFLVNFLSHSVLIGFTAAAAIIIGFSQVKHVLGVSIPRGHYFYEDVREIFLALDAVNGTTLAIGLVSMAVLFLLGRFAKRVPAALVVVTGSILAVELLGLDERGVKIVGEIPSSLPGLRLPAFDGSLITALAGTAVVITLVGFMESIAVAKVCARRYRYEVDPNQELIGLGVANVASGLFGGYAVTGGFSRTAVNDSAGARTPLSSILTAGLVLLTIAFLTPLFTSLPQAALGAIIIVAVINLIDVKQMRHIVKIKRSDVVGLSVAFFATLVLGIEVGIGVAVVASMLVVFARMSKPHVATLGRIPGSTSYRNVGRFPNVEVTSGIHVLRIDAALSFVNAVFVKRLLLGAAAEITNEPRALVLDGSGLNDIDATGADTMDEILTELEDLRVELHLSDIKGPVRDVLIRAGLWDRFPGRVHATSHQAVQAILGQPVDGRGYREAGVDERGTPGQPEPPPQEQSEGPGGEATWAELLRRHVEHAAERPHEGVPEHRPKAAILACSDARVPPSVLFGQPAGSLFIVRLAGSSATQGAVASLTYAVEALGTGLIVVLGHSGCGAVTAAVEHVADPALAPVVNPISDAIAISPDCRDVDEAVIENVRCNVRRLRDDDGPLGRAIEEGRVVVRGAVHDLASGELRPVENADGSGPAGG